MASKLGIQTVLVMMLLSGPVEFLPKRQSPEILHVGTVAPDTLGITVQAGRIEYGRQIPYMRQDGDQIRGDAKDRQVFRQGKFLGWLVGREEKLVYTVDQLQGEPLDTRWADRHGELHAIVLR